MHTYHKTAAVLVTGDVVEVRGRPLCRIPDIESVYVREVRESPKRRWTLRRSGPASVTAVTSLGVAGHDLLFGPGTPLLASALTLGVAALVFLANDLRGRPVSELRAVTGTGHVRLFRSRNAKTVAEVRDAVDEARRRCRP